MLWRLISFMLCFYFGLWVHASPPHINALAIESMEIKIRQEIKKQQVAGLSYAITQNGHVLHQGSQGLRDVENKIPFSLETRTSLGSITKTLISLGIYNLSKEYKNFHVDQKVSNILPWFDRIDFSEITVRHLLSHTSGLQRSLGRDSIANLDLMYDKKKYGPLYSEIEKITQDIELMYKKPGVMPQYSNFGYAILGSIIVKVAGDNGFLFTSEIEEEKLAQYMREKIFKPLGLEAHMDMMVPSRDFSKESIVYTGLFGNIENDSWAFRYVWPVVPNLGMAVAHSGVISDIQGLAKLNIALDKMVTGESYVTLSQNSFIDMASMEARSYDKIAKGTNWGYGNGGILYEKLKTGKREFLGVGHTGTGYGARTLMFLDPTSGIGVSLIINDKASNRHAFASILFDAVHDHYNFNPSRMENSFRKSYFDAKAKINEDVALNKEQTDLFPKLAKEPLTAFELYKQLQKSSGKLNVIDDLASLGSLDFVSGSFGAGSAYRFVFLDGKDEVSPENLSLEQLKQITVHGEKGGKIIPLFRDTNPLTTESYIREGFAPIFLLFSFQQLDFSFDKNGEISYLIFDRTFYQKARRRGEVNPDNSPIEVFPYAKKVRVKDFPFQ